MYRHDNVNLHWIEKKTIILDQVTDIGKNILTLYCLALHTFHSVPKFWF